MVTASSKKPHGQFAFARNGNMSKLWLSLLTAAVTYAATPAASYYGELLRKGQITGAAFAAVENGRITESAFFGQAQPHSLWRVASTTKTFTALAILRLHEQGRLDLDRDVNDYLKRLTVPAFGNRPITARHLLTHTSGLDDHFVNSAYLSPTPEASPWLPARIYAPGAVRFYTNYGYRLLGALLEDITGQPYPLVMRQEVLTPLGMKETTLEQPLPAPQAGRLLPTLERNILGSVSPGSTYYHRAVAAGGMSTTLADLLRLVQLVEGQGTLEGHPYLRPETIAMMLGERAHPGHEPEGYGFGFGTNRGQRYWYAGGDLGGYHTVILWFPASHRAFVTVAAGPSAMSTTGLIPKVMDHWFGPAKPSQLAKPLAHPQAVAFAARVAGTYRPVRYPHHDLGKTFIITMDETVHAESGGWIRYGGERWLAIGRLRFRHETDDRTLTFQEDATGHIRFLNRSSERIAWYESGKAAIATYFAFVILSLGLLWFHRQGPIAWLAAAVLTHSLAWLGGVLIADPQRLILGLPWHLMAALIFGITAVPAAWLYTAWQAIVKPHFAAIWATPIYTVYLLFTYYWNLTAISSLRI